MKSLFLVLFLNLCLINCYAFSVRSGEIIYTHISYFTYEVTVILYSNYAPIDSIEMIWGDGMIDTLVNDNLSGGTVVYNMFTGTHTFAGTGIYLTSISVNNVMDSVDNTLIQQQPFYLVDTLHILDPQFFGYNDSPSILNPPVILGYVNQTLTYTPNAYDTDGDSLSYYLVSFSSDYNYPQASDSIIIDGSTGMFLWSAPLEAGNYAIAILIKEWRQGQEIGTVVLKTVITISNFPSLVSEANDENFFMVSPDPAHDFIVIQLKDFRSKLNAQIINMAGQKILDLPINSLFTDLDITRFSQGLYFLRINDQKRSWSTRFIKQ